MAATTQRLDDTRRKNLQLAGIVAVVLISYPLLDRVLNLQTIGAMLPIFLFVLLALGLNIVVGFAGLLDLGYAAFFAIGAYTAAFLTSPVSPLPFRTDFWVAMVLSFFVAMFFGVVLGTPTLRLRGDYLAIVTLAFGEIVPRVFLNLEQWTGGSKGMNPIGRPHFFGIELGPSDRIAWFYLVLVIGAISVWAIGRLRNSRLGRAWVAMREDELAAASLGIDLVRTKLLAFALGASFSGFARLDVRKPVPIHRSVPVRLQHLDPGSLHGDPWRKWKRLRGDRRGHHPRLVRSHSGRPHHHLDSQLWNCPARSHSPRHRPDQCSPTGFRPRVGIAHALSPSRHLPAAWASNART